MHLHHALFVSLGDIISSKAATYSKMYVHSFTVFIRRPT